MLENRFLYALFEAFSQETDLAMLSVSWDGSCGPGRRHNQKDTAPCIVNSANLCVILDKDGTGMGKVSTCDFKHCQFNIMHTHRGPLLNLSNSHLNVLDGSFLQTISQPAIYSAIGIHMIRFFKINIGLEMMQPL